MAQVQVHKARSDQTRLKSRGRRCSVSPELRDRLKLTESDHIRVSKAGQSAYFVVDEIHESDSYALRTAKNGRKRLDLRSGDAVTVSKQVPFQSFIEARRTGGLAETVWDDEAQNSILVYAPHGGDIEFGTDDAAMRLYRRIQAAGKPCSLWALHGFNPSAFSRWHVKKPFRTSGCYPGFEQVADRQYDTVVSMHMHNESYTAIGGQADESLRAGIAEELRGRLRDRYDVVTDVDEMKWAGTADDNAVNGLAGSGGVQIELQPIVAYKYRKKVAESVFAAIERSL